jgi:hypothetical protein
MALLFASEASSLSLVDLSIARPASVPGVGAVFGSKGKKE